MEPSRQPRRDMYLARRAYALCYLELSKRVDQVSARHPRLSAISSISVDHAARCHLGPTAGTLESGRLLRGTTGDLP